MIRKREGRAEPEKGETRVGRPCVRDLAEKAQTGQQGPREGKDPGRAANHKNRKAAPSGPGKFRRKGLDLYIFVINKRFV